MTKDLNYFKKLDKKMDMVPLTFDKQFKSVFTNNEDILKEFLILQFQLNMKPEETKITTGNVELPDKIKNKYQQTIGVAIYLDDKATYNILYSDNIRQRNCVYFGNLHTLKKEKNIKEKRLYQLNLNTNENDNKYGEDVYRLKGEVDKEPLLENYAIFVKNIAFYRNLYYNKQKKLTKREKWLVALSSESFSELYEILIQILDKDKTDRFMESVVAVSEDNMILKNWKQKQLDELVKYNTLKKVEELKLSSSKND